ncbi:hypothetical protein D9M71_787290 [compost metagenome]
MPNSTMAVHVAPNFARFSRARVSIEIAIDNGASTPLASPWMIRAPTNSSGVVANVASSKPRAKKASAVR